jgi:biotin transporter BioY
LYQRNDFIFDYITDRIMTEPLYTLCSFVTLALGLLYVKRGRARCLYLSCFVGGLAYLTRPNGFFLMAALWGVLVASEILVLARDRGWRRLDPRRLRPIAWRFGIAGLIFVATAIPSWVPRLAYYGNPLHHGVSGNAMWVDTWEELRANQEEPLGPSHYFASHGLSDVIERFVFGFETVYLTAPRHYTPKIHLLAAAGVLVGALRRRRRDLVLIATAFLTLLPITWTSLPMPFTRIAYGAQLAFILLFSAILLELAWDLSVRALNRRRAARAESETSDTPQ